MNLLQPQVKRSKVATKLVDCNKHLNLLSYCKVVESETEIASKLF